MRDSAASLAAPATCGNTRTSPFPRPATPQRFPCTASSFFASHHSRALRTVARASPPRCARTIVILRSEATKNLSSVFCQFMNPKGSLPRLFDTWLTSLRQPCLASVTNPPCAGPWGRCLLAEAWGLNRPSQAWRVISRLRALLLHRFNQLAFERVAQSRNPLHHGTLSKQALLLYGKKLLLVMKHRMTKSFELRYIRSVLQ